MEEGVKTYAQHMAHSAEMHEKSKEQLLELSEQLADAIKKAKENSNYFGCVGPLAEVQLKVIKSLRWASFPGALLDSVREKLFDGQPELWDTLSEALKVWLEDQKE